MMLGAPEGNNQGNYMMNDNKKYYEKKEEKIIILKIKIVFNRLDGFIKK